MIFDLIFMDVLMLILNALGLGLSLVIVVCLGCYDWFFYTLLLFLFLHIIFCKYFLIFIRKFINLCYNNQETRFMIVQANKISKYINIKNAKYIQEK